LALTSVARVRDEYYPAEENTPKDRRKSRVIGRVGRVVHVIDVAHFRWLYERLVKESDGHNPSQSQMALNVGKKSNTRINRGVHGTKRYTFLVFSRFTQLQLQNQRSKTTYRLYTVIIRYICNY